MSCFASNTLIQISQVRLSSLHLAFPHRSSMSSATKWSRNTLMPSLTTPTSSKATPTCRKSDRLSQSCTHVHTFTKTPLNETDCQRKAKGNEKPLAGKHENMLVLKMERKQTKKTPLEMPSWIFCNIALVNKALTRFSQCKYALVFLFCLFGFRSRF